MNEWEKFIAEMKQVRQGIKAWVLLKRPMFEMWAQEGGEGIKAFAIAVVRGEAGREKAMALNTRNDTTSKIGFTIGLVEHDAFWIVVQGVLAGGKVPAWLAPILAAVLKEIRGEK